MSNLPQREGPASAADAASPRLLQELADTTQRSRLGGPFYVIGWLVVCLSSPVLLARPALCGTVGAAFVLGMVLRFAIPRDSVATRAAAQRRLDRVWLVVGATTALWGGVCAWVLLAGDAAGARLVVLICSIAFATAIAHSFCMRQGRALLMLGLLYLPVLGALLAAGDAPTAAAAIGIYLGYLLLLLRRSHREYQQRLDLDDDLRRQRDLFELQSQRDGLTGLANRRHFANALDRLVREAPSHTEPFALLILDLDHFKAVNDRHGHALGDACLREFAERLQRAFPAPDALVARLGGEEFAVLIDAADEDAACSQGEAFRAAIAGSPLVLPDLAIGITVSIGVGAFGPRHDGDGDVFFNAVDQALYRAKAEGRNAVRRALASR